MNKPLICSQCDHEVRAARPDGTRKARTVTLIETESTRGYGTDEDVLRIVREYWTLEGVKVAEYDPVMDEDCFTSARLAGE